MLSKYSPTGFEYILFDYFQGELPTSKFAFLCFFISHFTFYMYYVKYIENVSMQTTVCYFYKTFVLIKTCLEQTIMIDKHWTANYNIVKIFKKKTYWYAFLFLICVTNLLLLYSKMSRSQHDVFCQIKKFFNTQYSGEIYLISKNVNL